MEEVVELRPFYFPTTIIAGFDVPIFSDCSRGTHY